MKIKIIVALLGLISVASAVASSGTVTFTGTIQANGCDVTATTKNQTVDFGTISSKEFATTGDTAAAKSFHIDLENCPKAVAANDKVALRFDGVADAHDKTLLSVGSAQGHADNVGIMITNAADNSVVEMHKDTSPAAISYPTTSGAVGTAKVNLVAKLKSTANSVTDGTINSVADFSIIYQ